MIPRRSHRIAAFGAALVLGAGALGVASAQQTPTPTPAPAGTPRGGMQPRARHDAFIQALASKLGIGTDRLREAMRQTHEEMVAQHGPMRGGLREGRPGPGGPGPGGLGRGAVGGHLRDGLATAARALNMAPADLLRDLPGKSLADIARARGVDPTTVATALKSEAQAKIDQAVGSGRIPADRAAQMKQRSEQAIDQLMQRQAPTGPGPRMRAGDL